MGDNIEIEIPEEPIWETLNQKENCVECTKNSCRYQGHYGNKLSILIDCPKKARILNFLINWTSAVPIFFLVREMFRLTSGKFFLSLLILLIILFFYDMIFVIVEKLTIKFFIFLEDRRKEKHEEKLNVIMELKRKKKEQEEQEEKQQEKKKEEIENAIAICEQFKHLEDTQAIKVRFSESYTQMLTELKELCNDLQLEHFSNPTVKNLFKIYLPELIETCESFTLQYDKELLSAREIAIFQKLLITAKDKFAKVKQIMWQKETTNLYVNMMALNEALSTSNNKEDIK